jgi:hypothetical protein
MHLLGHENYEMQGFGHILNDLDDLICTQHTLVKRSMKWWNITAVGQSALKAVLLEMTDVSRF